MTQRLSPEREQGLRDNHPHDWSADDAKVLFAELDTLRAELDGARENRLAAKLVRAEQERDQLKAELALARERLGPAGYKILSEAQELRMKLLIAEEALEKFSNAKRRTVVDILPENKPHKYILMLEIDSEIAEKALSQIRGTK